MFFFSRIFAPTREKRRRERERKRDRERGKNKFYLTIHFFSFQLFFVEKKLSFKLKFYSRPSRISPLPNWIFFLSLFFFFFLWMRMWWGQFWTSGTRNSFNAIINSIFQWIMRYFCKLIMLSDAFFLAI